ncbi:MAG: xanthine dehydrogenase family protein molybdopterin-binding subunit [Actinomycetia bacterium]|nr:xanthine dehydrogenase family protein molybdopterin-binding subunit [Actinomycetes bacterium]
MTEPSSAPLTGQSISRSEDIDLLRGEATFTSDLREPALDGAVHLAFVRSPLAAGRIEAIDTTEALAMPGVATVLTGSDVPGPAPFSLPLGDEYAQPLLASGEVGFAGQVVAVVAAETPALAADAAEMVVVDYADLDPVLDLDDALAATPIESTRIEVPHEPDRFDADMVVELSTWSPRQLPAAIECRSVAAVWADDRLLVWSATQTPHACRGNLAKLFDLAPESIRVVAPAVGGGFGGKVSRTAEEYLVPVVARRLGRPARWTGTRSEYFATATQGRGERIDFTLAGSADGRITALRAQLVKDGGAYPLVGVMLPGGYTRMVANGCYDIGHVEFNSVAVTTNRPPTSAYRGAGRSPYIGGLERTIDRFAAAVGLDPVEVRRRNLITPDQMPYQTPTGARYDEADYPGDLERALELAGYDYLRRDQAARRQSGANRALGIGVACYNHMTTGGGGEEASVTIDSDGSATVVTGTTSQGHGHATTWAQIASDVLGIPVDSIAVVEGDTDRIATGVGAVGSRSLQTAGMAVHRASTEVVEQARQLAADLLEAAVDDIVRASAGQGFHVVGTPARLISWADVAGATPADELTCGDFYDTEGRNTFPSGTHVAVVEVDTETGFVELKRLVGVDDAGTVVNPMIVAGQIHGGMASAVGQVLGEVMVYDDAGNPLTTTFVDYGLPTTDQLPSFEIEVSGTASSFNPLGFKGIGESGVVGATPAVQNAIVDAVAHLGVHHIDLPCTPDRVWAAIQEGSPHQQVSGGLG